MTKNILVLFASVDSAVESWSDDMREILQEGCFQWIARKIIPNLTARWKSLAARMTICLKSFLLAIPVMKKHKIKGTNNYLKVSLYIFKIRESYRDVYRFDF